MKYWAISAGEKSWAVKLDIRDLGGHLDITRRARAGTLSGRVVKATSQVRMVGALPFGFLGAFSTPPLGWLFLWLVVVEFLVLACASIAHWSCPAGAVAVPATVPTVEMEIPLSLAKC